MESCMQDSARQYASGDHAQSNEEGQTAEQNKGVWNTLPCVFCRKFTHKETEGRQTEPMATAGRHKKTS